MSDGLTLMIVFLIGMLTGAGMFIAYGLYMVNKIKTGKKNLVEELKKRVVAEETRAESIKQRLIKASELAKIQMELRSQIDMPSKNALHSKHKNGLIHEINSLELEKISILKTILGDGFDPTITVTNEAGVPEQIPLSAYVALIEGSSVASDSGEDNKLTPPPTAKRVGKFVLHKGGKDDSDGTTH